MFSHQTTYLHPNTFGLRQPPPTVMTMAAHHAPSLPPYFSTPSIHQTNPLHTATAPMTTLSRQHQPLLKPVHFKAANTASFSQSQYANFRWPTGTGAAGEAVNFMDHLYFITNLVLGYLLENDLPQELMNSTLLNDPIQVLSDHRQELIKHFHIPLIVACACLCVGISIPLFGFMIACCWCTNGSRKSSSKARSTGGRHQSRSGAEHSSRSRHGHRNRNSSDNDWLALRETSQLDNRVSSGDIAAAAASRGAARQQRRRRNRHHHSSTTSGTPSELNYRSRSVPPSLRYESTCHPCLRTFFSSNLFIILLLISFFVVCAFVTNEYVHQGAKQLPKSLNHSLDEIQFYLNNTDHEINNLFRTNYNQLETELNRRLDTSGMIIKHKLAINSEAIALVNLSDIVSEFNDTKFRLERLDRELSTLNTRIHTAKIALLDLRDKIEQCPLERCQYLRRKYPLENFRIFPQYERLPDVKQLIRKVTDLMDRGIITLVQRGRDEFDNYASTIQRELNGVVPDAKAHLTVVGKRLGALADGISNSIHWSDTMFNQTRSSTGKLNQYTDYELYRRYASLCGSAIILFILLCYSFGWLFGSCRPQPTARTYKTRVKTSASASFPFSCGITTVFLLFLPLILSAIVLFITGSIGDKLVCRVIKHPEQKQSKQIYAMMQNKFLGTNLSISHADEDKVTIDRVDGKDYKIYRPNFADIVARCHQNQSIYKVLKLDRYDKVYLTDDGRGHKVSISIDKSFNTNSSSEFRRFNNIDTKFREYIKKIDIDTSRVVLLSSKAEEILSDSSLSLSFEDVEKSFSRLYEGGVNISPIDMDQLSKDINIQKNSVSNDLMLESKLTLTLIHTSIFNDQILPNITSSILNLKEGVRHLKLRMLHGVNNYGTVIGDLITKVRNAEKQLRKEGKILLQKSANAFLDELSALVDQYANHVKNQVENVVGQCEPVSRAINATTSALCDDIVLPFNGFWLSAITSLILILPSTLLAYALRGLYSLAKRSATLNLNYSYTDQDDETSYDDDAEDIALAYHSSYPSHFPHKPSNSAAAPSAPLAREADWSPGSQRYAHDSRPPPYAV